MATTDLSFIDESRALEVEAFDNGCCTSEFTLAPGPTNFSADIGEGNEEAIHGRPIDDVIETDERLKNLPKYVELARRAYAQRGLTYPFEIDDSRQSLSFNPTMTALAKKVAELSRIIRLGNPDATKFEKRAFRALQTLIGGWGVCVGSPRATSGIGEEQAIHQFRDLLLEHEKGTHWPERFGRNGDRGADGFIILGRGWGGPIAFYQSKNTGFDLEAYPEELARVPSILQDWHGKKVNSGRRIIRILALNTVLSIELKESIYEDRGEELGVHIIDAVDVLAAEETPSTHITRLQECRVL